MHPNPRADARTVVGALAYYGILTPILDPEVRILPRLVTPGSIVLDIGAGVGLYAFRLARLAAPPGKVLAFEPFPPSVRRLAMAARFLNVPNIEIIPSLLSDAPGEAGLSTPVGGGGRVYDQWAHVTTASDAPGSRMPTTTVDHEVASRQLPRVDFIKCDVEGYESAVFRGAERTVRTYRPAILCEIEQRWCYRYGVDADHVMEQIRSLGDYHVSVYEPAGLRAVTRVDPGHNDYFFLPGKHVN